jgi:heme-degrading monooxygenase HmoA
MSTPAFANTPEPPYWVVVFSSQRTAGDDGYGETADRMAALTASMPGFLGMESVRGADGFGITVCYWDSEDAIAGWRRNLEHAEARRQGNARWYEHYALRVGRVERASEGPPR